MIKAGNPNVTSRNHLQSMADDASQPSVDNAALASLGKFCWLSAYLRLSGLGQEDRRGLEPLDDEVNAQRRFPRDLRKCHEGRGRGAVLEGAEQDRNP